MGISQKEGVFKAFSNLNGTHTGKELREQVKCAVAAMLQSGEIEWKDADKSEAACLKYAGQLVSNYFKRDERISGCKYVPANPTGTRTKDATLRSIESAIASVKVHEPTNTQLLSALEDKRTARREELASAKKATKVLSPDELSSVLSELGVTSST
jgi:hypothetical protein